MFTIGYKTSEKAIPIAYIKGGRDDDKVIFLNRDNLDSTLEQKLKLSAKPKIDIYEYLTEEELKEKIKIIYGKKIRVTSKDYKIVNQLLSDDESMVPADERLKKIYDVMKSEVKAQPQKSSSRDSSIECKEYICYDGILQQLPRKNENNNIIWRQYAAAPSESGKSTYISNLVKEYKKLKPEATIYLFSDTPRDPVLDKLGVTRILLNEELIENPIDAEELVTTENETLVIMDDIDSIIDKKIFKQVTALRDQLLQKGRHHKISVICTNHKLTDYKNTSIILNESQYITLFPKATSRHNFSYILKTYCGMSEDEIEKAYTLPTRWITICCLFPRYVLYQSGVYLL